MTMQSAPGGRKRSNGWRLHGTRCPLMALQPARTAGCLQQFVVWAELRGPVLQIYSLLQRQSQTIFPSTPVIHQIFSGWVIIFTS